MSLALVFLVAIGGPSPREDCDAFLAAFAASDQEAMAILANRPALDVEYALVVHMLMERGKGDAAKKLADLRQAPEREALKRLLGAAIPTVAEARAWQAAEAYVQQPTKCFAALARAGTPGPYSLHGVRILWTRARAESNAGQTDKALATLLTCGSRAMGIGWLSRGRDAFALFLRLAPKLTPYPEKTLEAADGLVDALEKLDDRKALLDALMRRGGLRLASNQPREGRRDLNKAINLARNLNKPQMEGRLWSRLGLHVHVGLREPRKAQKFYANALKLLKKDSKIYVNTLHNMVLVLTDLAKYGEALERLDELLKIPRLEAGIRRTALRQRGYILRRQGRVEKSLAAYNEALAATTDRATRLALETDLGRLAVMRGDLRAAEQHFGKVLDAVPGSVDALSGRGAVRAMRGNASGADADFAAALALESAHPGRLLLQRAAARRQLGRIADARVDAAQALKTLIAEFESEDQSHRDYGNTAVAYVMVADLLLLEGRRAEALTFLEKGAIFFFRLQDVTRAIPAYSRWTLALNDPDLILQRFQVLNNMAEGTPHKDLKSMAHCVEGVIEWRAKKPDRAAARFEAAAAVTTDRERRATALAHWGLIDPARAHAALELVDRERLTGPQLRPFLMGESAEFAASIAARGEQDPSKAFLLIERARADRLIVALRGRAAILDALLPKALYDPYVSARSRLLEARAEGAGVADAETAFDAMVDTLRRGAPRAAALAFPQASSLAAARTALREHEALLLMLDDPYARRMVVVTRSAQSVSDFDPADPLKGLSLKGITMLLVVPDGMLSLDRLPWGEGAALDQFEIFYLPTAGTFVRMRNTPREASRGAVRDGNGPARLGPIQPGTWPQLLHIGTPLRIDCNHPQASSVALRRAPSAETTVLANVTLQRGPGARVDGVAAAAAVQFARGARRTVVSLVGPPPQEFWDAYYADCLDTGMTPDFALFQLRRQVRAKQPRIWAGVVLWGVPAR